VRILFHTAEDRLGDALIKLPAIMAARAACPEMQLIWSTATGHSLFARGLAPLAQPFIDEVRERSGLGTQWRELWRPRCREHFDIIVASERRLLSTLALKRISHRRFIAPTRNFLLSDEKPAGDFRDAPVFRQTRILFELALQRPLMLPTELSLPATFEVQARDLLPAGFTYVGFAPGAGGKDKCWPLEHFVAAARAQVLAGRRVVFFLGPEEQDWFERLQAAVPEAFFPERMATATARGPLLAIALARRLSAGVANDSGIGHLMAAGGRPLLVLYGRTNEQKFTPGFGQRSALRAKDFRGTTVADIPVDAVTAALDDALA
jgi:ADP-heptose:LPS heptosyltransferase